jgi:predicted transcriptional regulator
MITILDLKNNKKTTVVKNSKKAAFPDRAVVQKNIIASQDTDEEQIEACLQELVREGFASYVNHRYTLTVKGKEFVDNQRL